MELLLLQANGAALGLPDYWGPADEARRAKRQAPVGQKEQPKDVEKEDGEEDWEEDDEEESDEESNTHPPTQRLPVAETPPSCPVDRSNVRSEKVMAGQ